MSYVIVGGVVLVIGVLAAQILRHDPTKMGLVPYGENKGKEQRPASGAVGFSLKEAADTMQFWMVMLIFFCLGYCILTINVHLISHVTDLGISATTAANIFAVTGGVQIIGGVVLGGAADRIGNRRALAISFILIAAAVFWLVTLTKAWMLYLFSAVFGFGVGGCALESTVVAELFGIKSHGSIFGVTSCGFTTGAALGPFLTGYLFDITGSYQSAFLVCAAIGVVGLILSTILRPIKKLDIKIYRSQPPSQLP
jgi:MFS family permease